MNGVVKYLVGHTYKPLLEKYLSRKRSYTFNGVTLEIPPEVFHPGFFHSTKLLLQQLDNYSLNNKSLLELGAGSGLISFQAARKGAVVTATDLNRVSVRYLELNSKLNGIDISIVHSDLFDNVPSQQFDFVVINPPYYKRDALTEKELAWCCGSKGEYFQKLFAGLSGYIHKQSEVLMVLCDGCDFEMIVDMANQAGFTLDCMSTSRNLVETNFIFRNKHKATGSTNSRFAEEYLALRKKEGRIYTDQELMELPTISSSHPHAAEWAVRKRSAEELLLYLRLKSVQSILEVGCGNGWLANQLASIPASEVTAIDINHTELEQGARVFAKTQNLKFIYGDLASGVLKDQLFDVIVFAASIQYFGNLDEILPLAFSHLRKDGEVHIIDSFIYSPGQVKAARQRSKRYFENVGFPWMSRYYFHHSMDAIKKYRYRLFHNPNDVHIEPNQRERIFPWIVIQPND